MKKKTAKLKTTRSILRALFLLIAAAFVSETVKAQVSIGVRFEEIPNLTYQLDCVGDLPVNCSRRNLGELWTREFLKTDEDWRMLKEWTRLRDLYSANVRLSKTSETRSSVDLFDKIRIAGFQSGGIEDYVQKLDLLTAPADRAAFEKIVRYFEPRFKVWWQTEAEKAGADFARQTDVLLRSPKISEPVRQFYIFYQPVLPANYRISFSLFYVPGTIKESSGGQQLENYSLMEFKTNEKPAQRIDIAVHELCHFFYDNMKPENRASMEKKFRAMNRATAVPAFNLLNESLAAAFGNGMIARAVTPPNEFEKYFSARKSFYNNDSIDRAAKAIMPMLDGWLKNDRTINDAKFVDEYAASLEKAFGADLSKPKLYLNEMFLFADAKYGVSMRRDIRRTLETTSFYSVEADWSEKNILDDYRSNPHLNSLFVVHPSNLAELVKNKIITEAQLKTIQNEFAAGRQVLFSTERAPFTYVYVIVAKDSDAAKKSVEKLADARQFQGIYELQN